jgi:hypothetical protein
MRNAIGCACLTLMLTVSSPAQSSQASPAPSATATAPTTAKAGSPLEALFEANVKTEWEAFKNKDKKAYSDLLADDFIAIEDDTQGMRNKYHAVGEIERSVVTSYNLFAFRVLPLNPNAALVTYELTMLFPPKAAVRFKRVLVSEIWLKREGQWKMRYYQETRVR